MAMHFAPEAALASSDIPALSFAMNGASSLQWSNSLSTDGETDSVSSSVGYDADVEEEQEARSDTPTPFSTPGNGPVEQRLRTRQPQASPLSADLSEKSGCRKNCRYLSSLHREIDPTLTTVLSSSEYDDAHHSRKRSIRNGNAAKKKKRRKTMSSLDPEPDYSGLDALLLATYREAQGMNVGGSLVDDNTRGSQNETSHKRVQSGEEVLNREQPSRGDINDGVKNENLQSVLASLSTNGKVVLAPMSRKLDDVLMSFSGVPRLLLEADSPFRIVHTNAAYQRLERGWSGDSALASTPLASADSDQMTSEEERSTFVFAVRPDPKKSISHYLVELLPKSTIPTIQVVG